VAAKFRRRLNWLLLCTLALPALAFAARPARERSMPSRRRIIHGRRLRWTLLPGSRESQERQNAEIDRLQLPRIEDDQELEHLVAQEELVPIRTSEWVTIDPRLESSRRFCREWVRDFLDDIGQAYYKQFHQPIQVNSAVRTVEQQKRLRRTNRNAAPVDGETASSHLAGVTVDIARRGMSRQQRKWMVQYFLDMQQLGLVEAVEERRQSCFHVMVSSQYMSYRGTQQLAGKKLSRQEKLRTGD
jgi:uncharacterized protein YcbK (DUF882 family)